jgi:hypothetical protein
MPSVYAAGTAVRMSAHMQKIQSCAVAVWKMSTALVSSVASLEVYSDF